MRQNKRGILMLASMILSVSLMCGAQVVKATDEVEVIDGSLNETGGILLKDTNANGQIDEAHITINYAVAAADAIAHKIDEETTIGKFTVTDTETDNPVTIISIEFVSGDGTIAIFKLSLDESNVSNDTSETALDITYDATDSDLKITSGSDTTSNFTSVIVATIGDITEEEEEDDEDDEDDSDEEEDDEEITPPDDAIDGPAEPNINSGVTLYRMPGQHRVYVIKNKKKHWIKTPKEFEDANYNWSEIQEITAELLEQYPDAEPLVTELLRAIGDHKVYKLEAGKKRWIKTLGEFNAAGHNWEDVQEVSPEVLASYQSVVVSDLLRAIGDHKVYKIKDGKKRWVKTLGEFNAAGHHWKDVQEVPAQDLDNYPDSDSEDV